MTLDPAFPGRVWFVAHALRDIRNRLPDAFAGPVSHSKTQYSQLAGDVAKSWINDGFPADGSFPVVELSTDADAAGPDRFEVSRPLLQAVSDLVAGHLAIAPRKHESARRLFHTVAAGPVPEHVVQAWLRATNRAERFAHLRTKPLTADQEREFDEIFLACERALMAMANRSYENMDELDEILDSANR